VAAIDLLREALPAGVRVQSLSIDPSRGILQSGSIALWIGAAGAAMLALAAVAAVISAQLRSRRQEGFVLRALGLGTRAISAIRRWELVTALAAGLVIGMLAGVIVTLITVPSLASAAVPNPYASLPTTTAFDLLPLCAALGGLGLVLALLVAAYGRSVSNQVRRSSSAEDNR
jgi:predicted lysophospholipase L1 biosynthesis ABC-type transport system permease subunit